MTEARPILFGKLPSHGDFLARGLDLAAVGAWDAWMSDGLAAARAQLGDRFDNLHETVPPWRFVDAPGRLGETWRAGALAPSIDAAGRRFMIMLAADGLSGGEAGGGGVALAEVMEGLIYRAFDESLDADAMIEASRAPIATLAESAASPRSRWWTLGGPGHDPATVGFGPNGVLELMFSDNAVRGAP